VTHATSAGLSVEHVSRTLPSWCCGAGLVLCAFARAAFAAAPLIPLERFAAGPAMSAPRISPDGNRVVYITSIGAERFVTILDLRSREPRPILRGTSGAFRVMRCEFKGDNRLLCHFTGMERLYGELYPSTRLVALDADGSKRRVLFQDPFGWQSAGRALSQDRIVHHLPDDPHHVLIELADVHTIYPSVYRLNVDAGDRQVVVPEHPPVLSWLADREGVVRFGYGFRDGTAVYLARSGANQPWRTLEKFKRFTRARFEPLAFGPLPNQLFVSAPQERRAAVWQMDLEENRDFQLLFARPDVDVRAILSWPTDRHVAGFLYETDRPHVHFIDPLAAAVDQTLEHALPGIYHAVLDASRDGQKIVTISYSDVMPACYHVLDLANHLLIAIGREGFELSDARLAPVKAITVSGAGGINIPGYLTLPLGTAEGTRLPAVVLPHGGPKARDRWGYDPLVQLLANRGYAVLQLNFRGSTGYGEEWEDAGHQAWGTVMHDDITAGTHWLIDQAIADPARICIVGWSYGGYAALIGVVKEPQLYRCAVSIAGVSDLSQLARDDDRYYGGRDAVRSSTGSVKAELMAQSPRVQAERIKVPVLLVHGEDDFTVLAAHSKEMAKALSQHGVRNELVLIKDGDHSLWRADMRLTLYSKLEAFLAANLGRP
jgi:dipeptidyl aminopeptidase/acylaminoacyl peptidase